MTDPQAPATLLGQLAESATDALEPYLEKTGQSWAEWFASEIRTKVVPVTPTAAQGLVASVAANIERNKAIYTKMSVGAFTDMVTHLALGHDDPARQAWLASGAASDDDVLAALDADSQAAQAAAKARADEWAIVKQAALGLGPSVLPLLLKLLPVAAL